jgi:DNA-directed RNA polymerase specialized sigma24 family protein
VRSRSPPFDVQELKALWRQLLARAAHFARFTRGQTTAEDIVHDALQKLYAVEGELPTTLKKFMYMTVLNLGGRAVRDVKVFVELDDDAGPTAPHGAGAGLDAEAAAVGSDFNRKLLDVLQAEADRKGDATARLVLEAFEAGYFKRGDAMDVTGLDEATFDNAHGRIRYWAMKLPEEFHPAARTRRRARG